VFAKDRAFIPPSTSDQSTPASSVGSLSHSDIPLHSADQYRVSPSFAQARKVIKELSTLRRFKESICFTKILTNDSFLLIFLPSFAASVAASDPTVYSSVTVFFAECYRVGTAPGFVQTNFYDETFIPDSEASPRVRGLLSATRNETDESVVEISNTTRNFIRKVEKFHRLSLVKGIYASLLQNQPVDVQDLKETIMSCQETVMEIELSHFLNVLDIKRHLFGPQEVNEERITQRFTTVFSKWFHPVQEVEANDRKFMLFYFLPAQKQAEGTADAASAGPDGLPATAARPPLSFAEIQEYSERPLFVRLEVLFRRSLAKGDPDIESSFADFAATTLPTSFKVPGTDSDLFSPSALKAEPPFTSVSGTKGVFRFVLMTLPEQDLDASSKSYFSYYDLIKSKTKGNEDEGSESGIVFTGEGDTHSMVSDPLIPLNRLQRDSVIEIRNQVRTLLTEEIMTQLLSFQPVNRQTLDFVMQQLKKRHSSRLVSLSFVKQAKCRDIFPQVLSHMKIPPLEVQVQDDIFYCVVSPNPAQLLLPASVEGEEQEAIAAADAGTKAVQETILEAARSSTQQPRVPFWLVLSFQKDVLEMMFLSDVIQGPAQVKLLDLVQHAVRQVCERVNKMVLLTQLAETHRSHPYLIAPDDGDKDDMEVTSDEETPNQKSLGPGAQSCECVFYEYFLLPWRLKALQALRTVASSVFFFFFVNFFLFRSNTQNMFGSLARFLPSPFPTERTISCFRGYKELSFTSNSLTFPRSRKPPPPRPPL